MLSIITSISYTVATQPLFQQILMALSTGAANSQDVSLTLSVVANLGFEIAKSSFLSISC
jgi:hypothetical protein